MTPSNTSPSGEKLTPKQWAWLERLAQRGSWPDRPFLRDRENALVLMRRGLVEAIKPPAPYLPYVTITPAGLAALKENTDGR